MTRLRALLLLAGSTLCAVAAPAAAAAKCQMDVEVELKVDVGHYGVPVLEGRVNGQPVRVMLDSGAAMTLVHGPAARRLKLPVLARGVEAYGAGGRVRAAYETELKELRLGGARFSRFATVVAGESDDVDMLMGRDFLAGKEIEFDLRHGVVRLMRARGCADSEMPYWAEKGYSQADLAPDNGRGAEVDVRLNNIVVRAMIDSGAGVSMTTPDMARLAGVKVKLEPGATRGIDGRMLAGGVGELDSFVIGDERIGKTKLRVAELFPGVAFVPFGQRVPEKAKVLSPMILGADFLTSHRVLISPTHGRVFFTYEGGPVFDTVSSPPAQAAESKAPAGS